MPRAEEAVEAETRGIEEDPLNFLYRHRFRAQVGRRKRNRKVLELDRDFPLANGTLGAICAQQERMEEALELTERAHKLVPWSNPIV